MERSSADGGSVPHATDKQRALIEELGVPCPETCTMTLASERIALARFVACYVLQVAWQEWRQEMTPAEVRPIVAAVFGVRGMAEQVRETMDAIAQAAALARDEREALGRSPTGRLRRASDVRTGSEPAGELQRPELREDASYVFVKLRLQRLFPGIAALAPPPPEPHSQRAHVYLARDLRFLERLSYWLHG